LWSFAPKASVTKPPYLAAGIAGLAWTAWFARLAPRPVLMAVAGGVLLGLIFGGALVSFEISTQQAIARFINNLGGPYPDELDKHYQIVNGVVVWVSDANIKRRITIVSLLLFPATILAALQPQGRARMAALSGLLVIATIILLFSRHQSAQVALAAGLAAFGLAALTRKGARWLIGTLWCACALLVVPAVMWAHSTGIHKQPEKLFFSARARIVIWNSTVQELPKAPLLGIGADATGSYTAAIEKARKDRGEPPTTRSCKCGTSLAPSARPCLPPQA
jgi:O-Antigen ligase